MTKKNSILDRIDVREPCTESWEEMTGNEKVRFCSHCSKNVFDLSSYTRQRAEKLVRDSNGGLCVRYRKDERGRVVTAPPKFTQIKRHAKIAASVLATTLSVASMAYSQGEPIRVKATTDAAKEHKDKEPNTEDGFTVSGQVTDLHGAVIVGANVHLIHNGDISRTTTTNVDGDFRFTDITSKKYSMEISSRNFKKLVLEDVKVSGDLTFEKPFVLDVEDDVELVGELVILGEPLVCEDPPKVSSEIKLQEIIELPINRAATFVTMGLYPGTAEKPTETKPTKKSKKKLPN